MEIKEKDKLILEFDFAGKLFAEEEEEEEESIIISLKDITEQKLSEERVKLLTDQIEQFSKISADIINIEDDEELFERISSSIIEVSDFSRVLFYTFKDEPPFRDILGYRGVDEPTIERLKKVPSPKEEFIDIFKKGIRLGNQSCYVPHNMKEILPQEGVDYGKIEYPDGNGYWHREDNLFIALKDSTGSFIGMISVDDSKSGLVPTDESIRPLEMFANHITQIIQRRRLIKDIIKSREEYKLLIENINDGVEITQNDRFIYLNKQFANMLGYDPSELYMQPFSVVYTDRALEILEERGRRRKRGEPVPSRYETTFKKKDGSCIDIEANVNIIDYKGVPATFAVIRDITDRKIAEQERLKSAKLESISILAGGIAHDFNNILVGILGNITLAKIYAKGDKRVYERLVEAEEAAYRAKGLTHQLLTFSKGGEPVKKVIEIGRLVKKTANFALSGSGTKCEYQVPDDLWPVEVDEGQIAQVIQNLVINADQAMPSGGIIEISAENVTVTEEYNLPIKEGKYVKITIRDQGIGIPEKYIQNIFDPYFSTKSKGSGLGLATVHSIITKHNGFISVESEVGRGTTFFVYLPATLEEAKEGKETGKVIITGKGKVLIVDDEELVREVGREMLEELGYEVQVASDGAEAIEIYKKAMDSGEPIDVVILDLTIPGGMGGVEALKKLKELDPNVKAIVSSGYSTDSVMSEYSKHGFVGLVTKPYTVEELSKVLHEVLSS